MAWSASRWSVGEFEFEFASIVGSADWHCHCHCHCRRDVASHSPVSSDVLVFMQHHTILTCVDAWSGRVGWNGAVGGCSRAMSSASTRQSWTECDVCRMRMRMRMRMHACEVDRRPSTDSHHSDNHTIPYDTQLTNRRPSNTRSLTHTHSDRVTDGHHCTA